MDCSLPGFPCPWDFPAKNMGVGCHFLLQGIFQTQGSNPHLLHWQEDSLPLSRLGSPWFLVGRWTNGLKFQRNLKDKALVWVTTCTDVSKVTRGSIKRIKAGLERNQHWWDEDKKKSDLHKRQWRDPCGVTGPMKEVFHVGQVAIAVTPTSISRKIRTAKCPLALTTRKCISSVRTALGRWGRVNRLSRTDCVERQRAQ